MIKIEEIRTLSIQNNNSDTRFRTTTGKSLFEHVNEFSYINEDFRCFLVNYTPRHNTRFYILTDSVTNFNCHCICVYRNFYLGLKITTLNVKKWYQKTFGKMTNLVSKLFFHRFSPYILFVANLILKLIFRFQSRNSVAMPPYNFHQAHNRAF